MRTDLLSIQIRAQDIDAGAETVQDYYKTQHSISCSLSLVSEAMADWLYSDLDERKSQVAELLTKPGSNEVRSFEKLLKEKVANASRKKRSHQPALFDLAPSKYNGYRKLSPKKIHDLTIHLAYRKKGVFPTILNKLLFYSDLYMYKVRRTGITGIEYKKMEYGPAYPAYEDLLHHLEKDGKVKLKRITSKGKPAKVVIASIDYTPARSSLTKAELRIADWVVDTFGHLSTAEIIALSHQEKAWFEPHDNDTLDYNHADELNTPLPK